jgi:pyridoxine 4-dehydrogenase
MTMAGDAGAFGVGGEIEGQIALALSLQCSLVMLPIPGTSKVSDLRENVAAAAINLDDTDFAELDQVDRAFA